MDQLVEIQAIRSVIRRSFKGDSFTVIGEILQNAQRSKATEIRFSIDTEGGAISITDNGSGIEDLGALLVLGKSNYSVETISNQHPMGVGFHSILAHEEVRQVTISSCHQKITIDSQRWWTDYEYASAWSEYVESEETRKVTRINIQCTPELAENWEKTLVGNSRYHSTKTPATGYSIMGLQIWCNGNRLDNGYPNRINSAEILTQCQYLENTLKIYSHKNYWQTLFQYVNWYGQLIEVREFKIPFSFILEVNKGRPIDLQAPTRQSPIYNQKWQDFIEFLTERVGEAMKDREPDLEDLKAYYSMKTNFPNLPESPWFVADEIIGPEIEQCQSSVSKRAAVLRYDGKETLIDGKVNLRQDDEWYEYDGIETFVELVGRPLYEPKSFDYSRLGDRLNTFYWQPGKRIETKCTYSNPSFYEAGSFALTHDPGTIQWQPVTRDVYTIYEKSCVSIEDVEEWRIGCTTPPALAFKDFYLAGHSYDNDSDFEYYKEQTDEIAIELRGDVIPARFNREDLVAFVARREDIAPVDVAAIAVRFGKDHTVTIEATAEIAGLSVSLNYPDIELYK